MVDTYKLKSKELLYLCPVGDLHWGSPEFNEEYLQYWADLISRIKNPKRIYLMGDLAEAATKHLANSAFQATMSLDDQLDAVINFFKPFKKDIIFLCKGNHELRLERDYDLDITRIIANALGCPYGNQYIDTFNVNDNDFNVYTSHGKGSSAHFYTAESKIIRDTQHIQADIFINGHNHRAGCFSIPIRSGNGLKRRHYMFSGAFLSYGGYADTMQLPILPEAFGHLTVDKDCRVNPTLFYIDQRYPEAMRG
jgi:UDP-2,3-diacylglucosamine pyrophosphatase LpxH